MITDMLVAPWADVAAPGIGRVLTAADLAALAEDGWRYELVAGRLVCMPPPKHRHGLLMTRLASAIHVYVERQHLGRVYTGDVGYNLTLEGEQAETVLGADISFLTSDRVPPDPGDAPYLRAAPDLAIKVASPSQFRPDLGAKAWLWIKRGTRLVWVVWPTHREVDVWTAERDVPQTLGIDDRLDGADVLPSFSYALADLFA